MERYLIDTNVVSDYFSASIPPIGTELLDTIIDNVPNLSIITQIELLCWQTNTETEQSVKSFIEDSFIFNIDAKIVSHCAFLRRSKKIKTPDAIIAATAIAHNLILLTNNESDFRNIPKLKLRNPHNI